MRVYTRPRVAAEALSRALSSAAGARADARGASFLHLKNAPREKARGGGRGCAGREDFSPSRAVPTYVREEREREREARKQWDGPGLVIRRNAQTTFLARGESQCLEPIEAARGFLRFLTTT